MTRKTILLITLTLMLTIALAITSLVYARVQQSYTLQRSTITSTSGGALQGSGYTLNVVVGQPAIGESSGAGYKVVGGYPLTPYSPTKYIYLPLVMK